MLVDLALHAYSMVAVPLYDTLGADVVQYICSHAELAAVACAAAVLPTLLATLPECPSIKLVVRILSRLHTCVRSGHGVVT
jgi:long-chain acyl-CoA synthetase